MSHPSPAAGVLVAGAGPTGLLLAGDLAEAGVPVTVLERRGPALGSLSRAFAVHARTLEQLDARGLADELVAAGTRVGSLNLFLGVDLDLRTLPSRFPFLLGVPQYVTERLLLRRAREAGAVLRHGTELTGLRQDAGGVTAGIRETATGRAASLRAAYLVGADGHRSTVRAAVGVPFPGRTAMRSMMLADVRLGSPPRDLLLARGAGRAMAVIAAFGDGRHRVMAWDLDADRPADAPVGFGDVRDVVVRTHGTDYGMREPEWLSRFRSDERQAPRYRVGRVLLAGDAAHVHTPAGGQGMNTGLQDAANLSWKLAAVLRDGADDTLLDSYDAERRPVGRAVVRGTGALLRLAAAHRPVLRARRALAGAAVGHLAALNRRVRMAISGLGVSYRTPPGAHPLTGHRAPDLRLDPSGGGPPRLHEALRGGRFVLVAPRGTAPPVAGWTDRVRTACWASGRGTLLLVRPDGYIAWASEGPGADGLDAALRRWAGPAAP